MKEDNLENLSTEELTQMNQGLDEEIANVETAIQSEERGREELIAEILRKKEELKQKQTELAELKENNRKKEESIAKLEPLDIDNLIE